MIYLDNAATSWPKPQEVSDAVLHYMRDVGGSPGRSGHRLSIAAARIVYDTRELLASLFNVPDPLSITLCANATTAINQVLYGFLHPGDHVVTTSMEHNAVMRPLRHLQSLGVEVTVVACAPDGRLDARHMESAIRADTKLVVMNHASNVVGTILPVAEVGAITVHRGIPFLVDAAQTAGVCAIDCQAMNIDLLAFTGHKALFGPQGTGGLWVGSRIDTARLLPLTRGGTGSQSELEEQPGFLPDRYESGTSNTPGIAGLGASVRYVLEHGVPHIRRHEQELTAQLIQGLKAIPGVQVYGTGDARLQTATVSFNLSGMEPSDVALRLDDDFGVLCRPGLQCAPSAHRTLGTFPHGTVRFGLSYLNSVQDVCSAVEAVAQVARHATPG
jgi:cysteine desulfurase family protein